MFTVPIKLNFNTNLTDIFDLEVVPLVELAFISAYQQSFSPNKGGNPINLSLNDEVKDINYIVGLGLRGNVKYMLNAIMKPENFPREILYSFGMGIGLKYFF